MRGDPKIFAKPPKSSRRRILFVNDCGFVGGAGIALRRQVQSLLLAGYDVRVLCWMEGGGDYLRPPRAGSFQGSWLGFDRRPNIHVNQGLRPLNIIQRICDAVLLNDPDLVLFGNLHWAGWPLGLISAVRDTEIPTIAYLHDIHWVSGRCAYPGNCVRFLTGCNAECPTPTEYPPLPSDQIESAWIARRETFVGPRRIPIATNSTWTTDVAERGFQGKANIRTIWLGLDINLFEPFPKWVARRTLALPEDAVIAICGAVDLSERRKGGKMLRECIAALAKERRVIVLGFGHNSDSFKHIHGVGSIIDERRMPTLYNAADFFINAAEEEAFGQTLMEAAACGLPIVGTDVGGVRDIARPEKNALLVPYGDTEGMLHGVRRLTIDVGVRREMSLASRLIAESEFSLERQAQAWTKMLNEVFDRPNSDANT
jgi:glycosyltransferase involved in cell wall biosynthesis